MTSSETLIRAVFNRLKARMGKSIFSSISITKNVIEEVPDQIREEWNVLKEEIIDEASRIDEEENKDFSSKNITLKQKTSSHTENKIKEIRKKIISLSRQVEEIN